MTLFLCFTLITYKSVIKNLIVNDLNDPRYTYFCQLNILFIEILIDLMALYDSL